MTSDWDKVARLHGFVTLKHLLIYKYALEGRGADWISTWIGCSKWTIQRYLKRYGIPPHNKTIHFLAPLERDHWNYELKREVDRYSPRKRPVQQEAVSS